jgi:predicted amidophosphoribosyltransferase
VVTACAACWNAVVPAPAGSPFPAAMAHDEVGRRLLLGLKYRNALAVVAPLAARMVRLVDPVEVDVVTWAPTSARHRRRRGFDQAELLARAVAHGLGLPCRRLLRRTTSQAQTGRSRAERLAGPSFVARPLPAPQRVLVVDDVVTTGATLRAAAEALGRAGAEAVRCIAGAATP